VRKYGPLSAIAADVAAAVVRDGPRLLGHHCEAVAHVRPQLRFITCFLQLLFSEVVLSRHDAIGIHIDSEGAPLCIFLVTRWEQLAGNSDCEAFSPVEPGSCSFKESRSDISNNYFCSTFKFSHP
jgi:hypothetical protein